MTRPATIILLLLVLALLARFDRDGLLASTGVGARVLGVEVRVEVRLQRTRPTPLDCWSATETAAAAPTGRRAPCE